ncbi:zf-HC2 domain-containing protein [Paenibacillus yanchengensis]|uniref:Anti-sigma-W factor RsiW n=1 Tax=Paenibacillus yanchengensis TaxID=2035833 RepID=A0ABW4YFS4_9BACL
MECKVAIGMMHDYLDGELSHDHVSLLKSHMVSCPSCSNHFEQLEKTDASAYLVFEVMESEAKYDQAASEQLQAKILANITPRKKQRNGVIKYVYRHPFVAAAIIFCVVMLTGLLASWGGQTDLVISIAPEDIDQLVIEQGTIIVPEGARLSGNLTVEKGHLEVRGEVIGNITVVDGDMLLASTGKIVGQVKEINQTLDWFWFKISSVFNNLTAN